MAASIETEGLGELGAVFTSCAGELVGTANTVDDVSNLHQRVGSVGIRLPQVAGELGAEMADQAWGYAGDECGRTRIGGNIFRAVVGDGIVRDRTGGIEEYVVRSPVTRRIVTEGQLIARSEIDV